MKKIQELPRAYEAAQVEQHWYPIWEKSGYFTGNPDSAKPPYSIVIPPPNVTGILTLGHVLNNTLQDILCRRARMKGCEVSWFPGTDHAGIATESRVVKFLKETENVTRDELGREEFIRRVWKWRDEFGGKIIRQLRTLGCSCDWQKERFTMDEGLSNAVKKVFVQLYNKGYIYRGQRMINWCPAAKSALSDEEVIYRDVPGKFYYFRYPLADGSGAVTIATTRPETMFGDTAVAVHPDDPRYAGMIGKQLILPLTDRTIPIVGDIHADPTKGTGAVKITPGHDPNDFEVGKRCHLEVINIMNPDATLNDRCPAEFVGLDRFAARELTVKRMAEAGLLEKVEDITHAVGYSERGNVPIETLVSSQWFCRMHELAAPAIEAVKSGKIKFYPERWTKTYFHWLENIQDWCISRQLWWGHRIPAYYHEVTGEIYVGENPPSSPGPWRQEEDVLDTWFSSWLWPFSIMGWPENTADLKRFYPTCDLVTGPDIIFFWVARMIMAGYEFTGDLPFRNVYFTSIIRDDKGRKLSKSLGNSPDPLEVIAEYGADALRFSIVYIAPVGMDIRYSNEKCEIGRNFANKLWNACRFRQLQGEVSDDFDTLPPVRSADEEWMLSRLEQGCALIEAELEKFRFHTAAHALYELVWSDFCDWFVEAEKLPLRQGGAAKAQALRVLDYALWKILRLLHPFMPFVTEELAHRMGFVDDGQTIMYSAWPTAEPAEKFSAPIIADVDAKFELVRAGRYLRSSYSIADGRKLKFHLQAQSQAALETLRGQAESLRHLLNAEALEFSLEPFDSARNGAAPGQPTALGVISLPLAGLVDLDAERAKLTKQLQELDRWLAGVRNRLNNEKFVKGAPEAVVQEARRNLEELENRRCRTAELLAALQQ